ncbi:MAG: nitroreductase family protein [Euryarchaeota archaeon]|nr:nitroreductase family protein [Euryarchaeota archaeon]
MNTVFENIYLRRSVRDYKPNDVPDEIIKELIRAGTYAPFSPYPTRHQPRRFVVIKNREMMNRLSERAKKLWLDMGTNSDSEIKRPENIMKALKMPEFNIFYNATVLVFIFAMPHAYTSHEYDCAAAAENMLIAAQSLGIGSCWIGLGMPLGSDQNTLAELDVPEGYRLMMPLIFGYPVKDTQTVAARDEEVIFKWIT